MRHRKWLKLMAAAAVSLLILTPTVPAHASESGYEWMYTGPSPSRGYVEWNIPNSQYNNVQVNQSGSLAGGYCLTTWFDWNMNSVWPVSEHFDARAIRNCLSGGGAVSMTNYDPAPGTGWWYVGQQKLAFCYGPNHTTTGCVNGPQAAIPLGSVNANFNGSNWVTRWHARWSNGVTAYHSGGDPRSSTS